MIPDIQDEPDARGIELDEVGISGLRYPVTFDDGTTISHAIADFAVTVRLPAERRGTHMSRMVQLVEDELRVLDPPAVPRILKSAADRLDVSSVRLEASLPIATKVFAPITGLSSWQSHELRIRGTLSDDASAVETELTSHVTSLCPCSKAISDYGAHNQRSAVTLSVAGALDDPYPMPVDLMIRLIRETGSYPVYPLVKRPDERKLTMAAFDKPAFVEDIARDLSAACRTRGVTHQITVRNLESIHTHDAIARVSFRTNGVNC